MRFAISIWVDDGAVHYMYISQVETYNTNNRNQCKAIKELHDRCSSISPKAFHVVMKVKCLISLRLNDLCCGCKSIHRCGSTLAFLCLKFQRKLINHCFCFFSSLFMCTLVGHISGTSAKRF
ncbi:hypothetical protein AQUCO_00300328v1 [Aquilegia coerulea]|uniref:Uncharacterized protein n=1 Tax=Aquilegia coerulea TaxID=218851 RepID=A0A2G5EYF1_AQUCA|nr:hypothetical protein AQUCO_00300328v1 [Aquilegia coerulea]